MKKGREPSDPTSTTTDPSSQNELDYNVRLPGDGVSGEVETKDDQIAELQEKLTQQVDKTLEERFWLSLCIVVLIDCLIVQQLPFSFLAVLLLVQLGAGVYFARRMGLEKAAILLDTVARRVMDLFNGKNE